ncbi:NACHT domain-containing protein [Actinosynnema sp. NPDC004786]
MTGVLQGPLIQAGTVHGPITVVNHPGRDALLDVAALLARDVAARWRREEELRRVHDPFPLPVRWHTAAEGLSDHWSNIRRSPAGGADGALPLDGRLDQVVEVFRRVPSGRLVVLGPAGSGKTVLAVRFVLDMLDARTGADPVPVVFDLGSWDPQVRSLRDWLGGRLMQDYPVLAEPSRTGLPFAWALLDSGLVLPVLDGFDEMAPGLRVPAVLALNRTVACFLMTSRLHEYAETVASTDVVTAAACVELAPLGLSDVADYLPRSTRPGVAASTVWNPVLQYLYDLPSTPSAANLTAVLSTPLTLSLARAIYSDTTDHDPLELLDSTRYASVQALEDHLFATFVPVAYGDIPPGASARDPEVSRRYLSVLAWHMTTWGTRDLEWWRLRDAVSGPTRALWLALIGGLEPVLACLLLALPMLPFILSDSWGEPTMVYVLFVVPLEFMFGRGAWYGYLAGRFGTGGVPSRVHFRMFTLVRTRQVVMFVVSLMLWSAMHLAFGGDLWVVAVAVAVAVVLLVVVGSMPLWRTRVDLTTVVSPRTLMDADRTNTILQVVLNSLTRGLGFIAGLLITVKGHSFEVGSAVLAMTIIIGDRALWSGFTSTAWGQWVLLTRVWLPLTRQAPRRLADFLEDAHRRGVLRRNGAVYQFRHARLQRHLADLHHPRRFRRDPPMPNWYLVNLVRIRRTGPRIGL